MENKEQITHIGNGLLINAPAKINLSLLIAGKRPDGFHEIETIMAKINWYDEIFIEKGSEPGINLICKGPHWAPQSEENLVYKAAKLFLEHCQMEESLNITLTKNIPAGTGLGSASSDAAATLIGLNNFLNTEVDNNNLKLMAAQLGSDVAFFLDGPLAFCTGRGEKIEKIEKIFDFLVLLILPDISISTKKVYENYRHDMALYERLKLKINENIQKNRIDLVTKVCANMLETSCFRLNKQLAELKEEIEELNIGNCCLSGSGSTLYCLFDRGDEAEVIKYENELKENIDCNCLIAGNNRW